ncbi:hypothetical protein [Ferrimonas sediminicola]|nr:hypothetical protein [Ferrimonas sediminicola]
MLQAENEWQCFPNVYSPSLLFDTSYNHNGGGKRVYGRGYLAVR